MVPVALGFRAQRGGGVAVAVTLEHGEPRVVVSTFLPTAAVGDRLALEPYGVAAEMPRPPGGGVSAEARTAVAEGRERQGRLAAEALGALAQQLHDAGFQAAAAALLVNRAGWVTDLLSYSLEWREHVPVAEGLAVRDAFRVGLRRLPIPVVEVDEKSLPDAAAKTLGFTASDIDGRLKALGATVGRPWRKEQKLACLAAWHALVGGQATPGMTAGLAPSKG